MSRAVLRFGATLLALWLGLFWAAAAAAHEVRPAYLEIDQTGPGAYAVTWKQPTMGDLAIHLVPHLSSGWLDAEPSDQFAADGFLIKQWKIEGQKPKALEGQAVAVDGLADTITDVFVRAKLSDGRKLERMLRPQEAQARLAFEGGVTGGLVSFLVLGVLPLAWIAGGSLAMGGVSLPAVVLPAVTAALFLAIGGLLAANAQLVPRLTAIAAATLGAVRGLADLAGVGPSLPHTGALLGMAGCVFALFALAASLTLPLKRLWMIVAVRVGGSWLAATGLLLAGWIWRYGARAL